MCILGSLLQLWRSLVASVVCESLHHSADQDVDASPLAKQSTAEQSKALPT